VDDDETPRDRLIQAFDMFEFGVELMASNLRRRHPNASTQQIESMLEEWLAASPSVEAEDEVTHVPSTMFR
jgi:hypothetical protein